MFITTLEYRVVHNNVDCGGDNFGTPDIRRSFELFRPAKVKSVKTGPEGSVTKPSDRRNLKI